MVIYNVTHLSVYLSPSHSFLFLLPIVFNLYKTQAISLYVESIDQSVVAHVLREL